MPVSTHLDEPGVLTCNRFSIHLSYYRWVNYAPSLIIFVP
jgi:hypothetical protein